MHSRRRIPAERGRHAKRFPDTTGSDSDSNVHFLQPGLTGMSNLDTNNGDGNLVGGAQEVTVTVVKTDSTTAAHSTAPVTTVVVVTPSSKQALNTPIEPTIPITTASLSSSSTSSSTTSLSRSSFVTATSKSSTTATSSVSSTSENANSATTSSKSKTPTAAIAVVVVIVVLGIIGVAAYFLRKRSIARRQQRRATWSAGLFPSMAEKPRGDASDFAYTGGDAQRASRSSGNNSTLSPVEYGQPAYNTAVAPTPYAALPPPTASYNNPITPATSISHPASLAPGNTSSIIVPSSRATPIPFSNSSTVRCAFIPSLPDELSITTGESVRVLAEYDDGWALCANVRGEQGMVPLECLDCGGAGMGDWRNQKRASSLIGGGIGSVSGPGRY